jgi:hypothetical protein
MTLCTAQTSPMDPATEFSAVRSFIGTNDATDSIYDGAASIV